MRRFLWILLCTALFASCSTPSSSTSTLGHNDTLTNAELISPSRFGPLYKGIKATKLNSLYGDNNIKRLNSDPMQGVAILNTDTTHIVTRYFIFSPKGTLQFVATVNDATDVIERINVLDSSFRTKQNIGLNSTLRQIKEAYKDISIIQDGEEAYIYIASLDMYMPIETEHIAGFNSKYVSVIPIDSVSLDTKPTALYIDWYANQAEIFSTRFWDNTYREIIGWCITELPAILILIALFIGLLKLKKLVVRRIKHVAIHHATKDQDIDTDEALKRINTLTRISHDVGSIILWLVFILLLLSRFNINIAPILASAGIVGLAVGFGAQELVRDVISGFFILFENQIRTGDTAIIDNVSGMIEKIELRTITMRDMSGVVHIFQNGKINSMANMTKEWSAMVLKIGVAYKEDIDTVMQLMREVGDGMVADEQYQHDMLENIKVLGLNEFGDSAIIIKAVLKTKPMRQWAVKREYQRRLKIVFDAKGIEIPFPHMSIYTGEVTKPMPINIDKE